MKLCIKNLLADSFEELLQEKPFDSITITDITDRCGAARSTFYKHFSDKYDIMVWRYHCALNNLLTKENGVAVWREGTLSGIRYLAENRNFFLKIIDYKGQNSVHDFLYDYSVEFTQEILRRELGVTELPHTDGESIKLYLMGTSRYIMEWLKTMHMTPEELAEFICNCIPVSLKSYFK